MTDVMATLGRVFLSVVYLGAGWNKLMGIGMTAAYFGRLGLPAPTAVAWLVAAFELIAGLMILVGFKTRWTALALAAFTAVATYFGHKFWSVPPEQYLNQLNHAMKNLAIIGGFLLLAAHGAGRLSADGRRR